MKSLDDIIKMAGSVQAELQKAQENLDNIEVEGVSGGGLVKIRASAKGRIIGVEIDESLLAPSEKQMHRSEHPVGPGDGRGSDRRRLQRRPG